MDPVDNTNASIPVVLPDKARKIAKDIKVTDIRPDGRSTVLTKAVSALNIAAKVVFSPATLFMYGVSKSCSKLAASQGIGDSEARTVDESKRERLAIMGGTEITFGFPGKPVLEGMFFEAYKEVSNPDSKTILLCTGSHDSYENYAVPMVQAFLAMGHSVMTFNYEGFGKSEGTVSEKGVYRSVEAAYRYLKEEKHCKDDVIVAWGYSLGSGAVSDLASKHTVDVVIDRGFSSMSQVSSDHAPTTLKTTAKVIFSVGAKFDNLKKLKKATGNVFVAQGTQDMTMRKETHGDFLREAISQGGKNIYREVESEHLHKGTVWFSGGEDRKAVEKFLNRPVSE